jgi:acyl carrier protein
MKQKEIEEKIKDVFIENHVEETAIISDNVISDMVMTNGETMDSLDWTNIVLGIENEFSTEITDEESEHLYGGSFSNLVKRLEAKLQ